MVLDGTFHKLMTEKTIGDSLGIINHCTVLYIYSSTEVNYSDNLPSKSPILIIMYHLHLKPESYELMREDSFYKIKKPN